MEKGWKQVFMSAAEYTAEMAKDILEKQNIKVVVLNQHDSAFQNFGDFCLYVSEQDEQRAIELLKDLKH
jgi:hypothetical protein